MKIYRTFKHGIDIDELELVKETEKCVVYLRPSYPIGSLVSERSAKVAEWHRFYHTRREAQEYLLDRESKKLEMAKEDITKLYANIDKLTDDMESQE
jgi:uncharacterized protein YfcZ (UPF0381/DUF406 family)